MSRKPEWPPRIYQVRGKDAVRIHVGGRRVHVTLGPAGSAQAREAYLRILAEHDASGGGGAWKPKAVECNEVVLAYLERCEGSVDARQYNRVKTAMAPVLELYGHSDAARFGPLALEAVRHRYVQAGYCRRLCNQLTDIVRQAFRWAASREMVSAAVVVALKTLPPLASGKTAAPDHPRVLPADPAAVEATLPHLSPVVADMVRVQRLVGCRPGEACLIRGADIVRPWKTFGGVEVWLYHLDKHKTAWRGGEKNIAIGPRAQAILLPYLEGRDPEAYCFSPRESAERCLAARRAARKTPAARARADAARAGRRKRPPAERYTTAAYDRAVSRAVARAGVAPWAPNQLRHEAGTRVEAAHGREAARSVLGHANASTTSIYAELSERAGQVAAKDG